eukprot:COSAG04_NODE_3428_length_2822_cov_2.050312_2_plen_327_part_00
MSRKAGTGSTRVPHGLCLNPKCPKGITVLRWAGPGGSVGCFCTKGCGGAVFVATKKPQVQKKKPCRLCGKEVSKFIWSFDIACTVEGKSFEAEERAVCGECGKKHGATNVQGEGQKARRDAASEGEPAVEAVACLGMWTAEDSPAMKDLHAQHAAAYLNRLPPDEMVEVDGESMSAGDWLTRVQPGGGAAAAAVDDGFSETVLAEIVALGVAVSKAAIDRDEIPYVNVGLLHRYQRGRTPIEIHGRQLNRIGGQTGGVTPSGCERYGWLLNRDTPTFIDPVLCSVSKGITPFGKRWRADRPRCVWYCYSCLFGGREIDWKVPLLPM